MYEKAKAMIADMEAMAKELGVTVDDVSYEYEQWAYDGGACYEEEGILDSWPYFKRAVEEAKEDEDEQERFPSLFPDEDKEYEEFRDRILESLEEEEEDA